MTRRIVDAIPDVAAELDADERILFTRTHIGNASGLLCGVDQLGSVARGDAWVMKRADFERARNRCEECERKLRAS